MASLQRFGWLRMPIGFLGALWILTNPLPHPDYWHDERHHLFSLMVGCLYWVLAALVLWLVVRPARTMPASLRVILPLALLTLLPISANATSSIFWLSNLVALGMIGWALHGVIPLESNARRAHDWLLSVAPLRFLAVLVVAFLALCITASLVVFDGIPHIHDSLAQYLHARVMADGEFAATSHPQPEFFELPLVINSDGRWYSQFPPGHILALALGHLAHAPWLVNPLLGAASLVLTWRLGRLVADESVARLAALMFLWSPFTLWMSSEYMNHASALFWALLMANALVEWVAAPSATRAAVVGLGVGMLAITRPLTALALAMPVAGVMLWQTARDARRVPSLFAAAVPVCACLAFFGYFNLHTTGDAMKFGYVAAASVQNTGFGWGPSWPDAVRHTFGKVIDLNHYLLGLPVPSLAIVMFACCRRGLRGWPGFFALLTTSLFACYAVYSFTDRCFGPRFTYEISAYLIILCALVMHEVWRSQPRWREPLLLVALACFAISLLRVHPMLYRGYENYWNVDANRFQRIDAALAGTRSLVFVNDNFRTFASRSLPRWTDDVIYAIDLGPRRNRDLIALYPHHRPLKQTLDQLTPYPGVFASPAHQ